MLGAGLGRYPGGYGIQGEGGEETNRCRGVLGVFEQGAQLRDALAEVEEEVVGLDEGSLGGLALLFLVSGVGTRVLQGGA